MRHGRFFVIEAAGLAALTLALMLGTWAAAAGAGISSALVRLHVVAVSDSEAEQAVKLEVRDAVLGYLSPVLADADSPAEARELIAGPSRAWRTRRSRPPEGGPCTWSSAANTTQRGTTAPSPSPPGAICPCASPSARGAGTTGGAWSSPRSASRRRRAPRPASASARAAALSPRTARGRSSASPRRALGRAPGLAGPLMRPPLAYNCTHSTNTRLFRGGIVFVKAGGKWYNDFTRTAREYLLPGGPCNDFKHLRNEDEEIFAVMQCELQRQRDHIELIASENFTSPAGDGGRGQPPHQQVRRGLSRQALLRRLRARGRRRGHSPPEACELFGAEHANVQPHAGSQANVAVYLALCKPGDVIMGMDLACGGHLTHGAKASITASTSTCTATAWTRTRSSSTTTRWSAWRRRLRPKMIISGASAYSRIIDWKRIREICDEVGAYMFVDMAHIGGLVAAGVHPSPVPYADVVTTTTHKTLRGPRGALILCKEALAKRRLRRLPGSQGGPLMHIIAAKAVCFREAMSAEFIEYQKQVVKNAAALADTLKAGGMRLVSGGTDNHLLLADVMSPRRDGPGRAGAARPRAHHGEQERDTLRHPAAPSRERRALRLPAATTRGHEGARDASNRRIHTAPHPRGRGCRRRRARRGAGAVRALPAL